MKSLLKIMTSTPQDKVYHMLYGLIIFVFGWTIFSVYIGLYLTLIIAGLKEIYDEIDYNGFDLKDILYTIGIPTIITLLEFIKG